MRTCSFVGALATVRGIPGFIGEANGSITEPVKRLVRLHINLLGFAVGQISYSRPSDRPLKRAVWQFTFVPGW